MRITKLAKTLRSNGSERWDELEENNSNCITVDADETLLDTIALLKELVGDGISEADMCHDCIFRLDIIDEANKAAFIKLSSTVKVMYELLNDPYGDEDSLVFIIMKNQADRCCVSGEDSEWACIKCEPEAFVFDD